MKLKRLQLKNFLSHQDTVIEFKPQQKLLLDGVSGSGKSSVVDAILWGLYGRARVDNRSLIKTGETFVEVKLMLDMGDSYITIKRKVDSEGKQTLQVATDDLQGNTTQLPVTGVKAIQEYIEKRIVGSSYELFINSVIYPQENPESFVRQNATKRKDILLEVAKASYFDEYAEKTKDKLEELALEKVKVESDMVRLDSDILREEEAIKKGEDAALIRVVHKALVEDGQEKRKKYDETKLALSSLEAEYKEVHKQNALLVLDTEFKIAEEKKYKEVVENWKPAPTEELEKLVNTIPELEEQVRKHDGWKSKKMALLSSKPDSRSFDEMEYLEKQLEKELSIEFELCPGKDYPCPPLTRSRDARVSALKEKIEIKEKERQVYADSLVEYTRALTNLGEEPEDVRQALSEARTAETKLNSIKASNDTSLALAKSALVSLEGEIDRAIKKGQEFYNKLTELSSNIYPLKEYIEKNPFDEELYRTGARKLAECDVLMALAEDAKKRYDIVKASREVYEDKYTTLKQQEEALGVLKTALGANGIKATCVDYILPKLEERINSILEKLSDFRVRLDTQRPNATGEKMLEGLFITISNGQGASLDFDGYSGGEKIKIVVAITEALAEIQNAKFRVMDEAVVALDSESVEKFGEIMMALQERFSQFICISHVPEIKSLFNEKLTVSKVNGTSTVC